MNAFEYAQRYGKRKKQVLSWLDKGRVRGAVLVDGEWVIPADARVDYYVRKRRNRSMVDDTRDILKALEGYWYVDAEVLGCRDKDFADAVAILESMGFVRATGTPCDGVTCTGFALTPEGIQAAAEKKKVFLELYKATIESISKAAFEVSLGQ